MKTFFINSDCVKDLKSFLNENLGDAFNGEPVTKASSCLTGTINGVPIVVTPNVSFYDLQSLSVQIKGQNKDLVIDKLRPLFVNYLEGQLPICYYETRRDDDPNIIWSTLEWDKSYDIRINYLLSNSNSKDSRISNLEVFDSMLYVRSSQPTGKDGQILLSPDGYCEGIIGDEKNECLVFGFLDPSRLLCLYVIPVNGKEDTRYYSGTIQYCIGNIDACGFLGRLYSNDSSIYSDISVSLGYAGLEKGRDSLAELEKLKKDIFFNKELLDGDRKKLYDQFQSRRAEICRSVNLYGIKTPEQMRDLVFGPPKGAQLQKGSGSSTN